MFCRPDSTYEFDARLVPQILGDEANPLNQIAKLIPNGAKVLDVGAGNGILAQVLMQSHRELTLDGIEPNAYAVSLARKHYRVLHHGFAQDFKAEIQREHYDFIVLADVLEHVQNPQDFLGELCDGLPEQTRVIITTPNIAFGAVRIALLNGLFDYVDSGILEKTHVRFFTWKTLQRLLQNLGMNVERLYLLKRSLFASEFELGRCKIGLSDLWMISADELASTYQFLCVLTKKNVPTETASFGKPTKWATLQYVLLRLSNYGPLRGLARVSSWLQRIL